MFFLSLKIPYSEIHNVRWHIKGLGIAGVKMPIYFFISKLTDPQNSFFFFLVLSINIIWNVSLEHSLGGSLKKNKNYYAIHDMLVFIKGVTATWTFVNIHKLLTFLWTTRELNSTQHCSEPHASSTTLEIFGLCQMSKTQDCTARVLTLEVK